MATTIASQDAPNTTSYPRRVTIALAVELEISSPEQDGYIFAAPAESSVLQIGFLADLIDILSVETDLSVTKVNSYTREQISKILSQGR